MKGRSSFLALLALLSKGWELYMSSRRLDSLIEEAKESALKYIGAGPEDLEKGLELHKTIFTCDLFGFLPRTFSKKAQESIAEMIRNGASYQEVQPMRYVLTFVSSHIYDPYCREEYLKAIRAPQLDCTIMPIGSEKSLHDSLHRISWYIQLFDGMREYMTKCISVDDIESARKEGKLAVICNANCAPAQGGLLDGMDAHHWIDIFYRFGVRVMHLTYNRRNWVGDGCLEPANGGLSLHGQDVVKHLNRIGVIIDTAHSGERTTIDAAKFSRTPIVATHTTCKALYDHPRGKTDDEIRAIADGGGLVGICAIPSFLGENASVKDLLDHVDYAVNLVGPDHVAIGTDTGVICPPAPSEVSNTPPSPIPSPYSGDRWFGAWESAPKPSPASPEGKKSLALTNWPYFTVGLLSRGYSKEDIEKIMGKNFLRVFTAVEAGKEKPA